MSPPSNASRANRDDRAGRAGRAGRVTPAAAPRRPAAMEGIVAAHDVIVTCGSGGVGKTTVAASLGAVTAANLAGKVLVLTVDPARRLATAMGLPSLGNVERRVSAQAFSAAGVRPKGELWAAMLDTKASWDDLVRQHAPDHATRDAILSNPLYRNLTATFTQSHDYIAVERLHEIHASGRYDLIVVDTPPTRNALDFLAAPARMADFFSSRLLRWLIAPYRSRLVKGASRPFYALADRMLGARFLADIAEFFILFQSMYDGFVERARAVDRTLRDPRTTFVVVTTLEPAPAQEAMAFAEALTERGFPLAALIANRVLPTYFADPDAQAAAESLVSRAAELAESVHLAKVSPAAVERVLAEVGQSFANYRLVAGREAELAARLGEWAAGWLTVPALGQDVCDLGGLLAVGAHLWAGGTT